MSLNDLFQKLSDGELTPPDPLDAESIQTLIVDSDIKLTDDELTAISGGDGDPFHELYEKWKQQH